MGRNILYLVIWVFCVMLFVLFLILLIGKLEKNLRYVLIREFIINIYDIF